jgi:hypothetical protein
MALSWLSPSSRLGARTCESGKTKGTQSNYFVIRSPSPALTVDVVARQVNVEVRGRVVRARGQGRGGDTSNACALEFLFFEFPIHVPAPQYLADDHHARHAC